MAGPGLPENIDATYPNDGDPSVDDHQQHHDAIHDIVNKFEKDTAPSTGQLLRWDGSLWQPVNRTGCFIFTSSGNLAVGSGGMRLYNDSGRTLTISSTRGSVGTAPSGASILIDININGSTIWTTQSNRITIVAGSFTDQGGTPNITTLSNGQYLTFDIDQVGSTVSGANLTVAIWVNG